MDTKVGPIGGLYKPREAESADTRYGLLRQDSLGYRKGRKRPDASEGLEEDQATVSIEALMLYLESFIARRFGVTSGESGLEKPPGINLQRSATNIEALRLKAAHAVKAYEHAAHVSHKVARQNAAFAHGSDLEGSDHEVEFIISLIRDLRLLAQQDVGSLQIERGEGFIESLASAVLKAKQDVAF
ncbi:MAG: hypothetical protein KJ017_08320 [Alphaproteobacteria bacterium]|nr:hypothetical protein [Alphaproteobacteria bacterium]